MKKRLFPIGNCRLFHGYFLPKKLPYSRLWQSTKPNAVLRLRRRTTFDISLPQKIKNHTQGMVLYFCLWATKKIFLPFCNKVSNSNAKSRHSRGYHQFRRNCISPTRSVVYHHCEKKCSLWLMIYTFGDEMHACA